MAGKKEKSKEPSIGEKIGGFVILIAAGWFGWSYLFGGVESAPKKDPNMTLAGYKKLGESGREKYLTEAISTLPDAAADKQAFLDCMGDFAFNKSESLLVKDVLGWCEQERKVNRSKFMSHFNELDAKDLSSQASIVCKDYVRQTLKAPATADFPLLDFSAYRRGGNHWTIKSYVDAQNGFGAQIRNHYSCDMQYSGTGDPLDAGSWKLLDLSLNP